MGHTSEPYEDAPLQILIMSKMSYCWNSVKMILKSYFH